MLFFRLSRLRVVHLFAKSVARDAKGILEEENVRAKPIFSRGCLLLEVFFRATHNGLSERRTTRSLQAIPLKLILTQAFCQWYPVLLRIFFHARCLDVFVEHKTVCTAAWAVRVRRICLLRDGLMIFQWGGREGGGGVWLEPWCCRINATCPQKCCNLRLIENLLHQKHYQCHNYFS